MSRIILAKEKQKDFLNKVHTKENLSWAAIAEICNICERTLRDWRREKYKMTHEALLNLHKASGVLMPKGVKILPEFWNIKKTARLGAIRRNKLYGNPGTAEGRRKGGLNTMRKFRNDPAFAEIIRWKLRVPITTPVHSSELAEFIGIMLGDGFIKSNKTQLGITLNSETDYAYAKYIEKLIKTLFNLKPSIIYNNKYKYLTLFASNKNLIEFLIKKGLKAGYKVINQVDIPRWIRLNRKYCSVCLKGLIDTDGSFYLYKHKVHNRVYQNFAICFTNYSAPLRKSVYNILRGMNFSPVASGNRVYLYRKNEIIRYRKEIGTSNPKHLQKYKNFIKTRKHFSIGGVA